MWLRRRRGGPRGGAGASATDLGFGALVAAVERWGAGGSRGLLIGRRRSWRARLGGKAGEFLGEDRGRALREEEGEPD